MKHEWVCEECTATVLFEQPELTQDDYRSEQNKNRSCDDCGGEMYFDEVAE